MPWLEPRRAEFEVWSAESGDIAFGPGDGLLVTERFAARFQEAGLTGLRGFEPVEIGRVVRRGGGRGSLPRCPTYLYVTTAHGGARLDPFASGMETRERVTCNVCRSGFILRYARVRLSDGTWSGEDVFFAWGLPGLTLVSERFAEWFVANGINNGTLVPADKYSEDFYPSRGPAAAAR
jgi:hypothetical protein